MNRSDQFQSELTSFERALVNAGSRIMRGLNVLRGAEGAVFDFALDLQRRAFKRLLQHQSVHICTCTHVAVQHRTEPTFNGFSCHECRVCGCKTFRSARDHFGRRGFVSTGEIFSP